MDMRHVNCQNSRCGICLADHLALGKRLEKLTGDDKVDHLGKYHKWLGDNDIPPETEWGWATPATFDDDNIASYVEWYSNDR